MGDRRLQRDRSRVGRLPVVVRTGPAGPQVSAAASAPAVVGSATAALRRQLGTRWRLAVVVLVALLVATLIAMAGLGNSLIYYRTPTGLVHDRALAGKQVRVGGLVEPGSLHLAVGVARFTLTDGVTALPVVFTGQLVGVFRAGQDALVEGSLGRGGVFLGTSLVVKHSNVYRAPNGKAYRAPNIGGRTR